MIVGIHDAEADWLKNKAFPNYALMKISAWHKKQGDAVEPWAPLMNSRQDICYSSKVFDFTPENPYLPEGTIYGGTGYINRTSHYTILPKEIDGSFPDYSLYPSCDYAIGYITRGCLRNCRWCVVPEKEGGIRFESEFKALVRPDTDKLVLMDNNILASGEGMQEIVKMAGSGVKVDFNQGLDARLMDKDAANALSKIGWIRYIRFSCDASSQIGAVENAIKLLGQFGVKPYRIFVYLLVTEDLEDASARVEALKGYKSINLYAQAERNNRFGIIPNKHQLEFAQRYVYSGAFRKESWEAYLGKRAIFA